MSDDGDVSPLAECRCFVRARSTTRPNLSPRKGTDDASLPRAVLPFPHSLPTSRAMVQRNNTLPDCGPTNILITAQYINYSPCNLAGTRRGISPGYARWVQHSIRPCTTSTARSTVSPSFTVIPFRFPGSLVTPLSLFLSRRLDPSSFYPFYVDGSRFPQPHRLVATTQREQPISMLYEILRVRERSTDRRDR